MVAIVTKISPLVTENSCSVATFYDLDTDTLKQTLNPLTPEDFHVFEWFSAFTCPIGFRDSIFKVTIESTAVLKARVYWKRHCDVVILLC